MQNPRLSDRVVLTVILALAMFALSPQASAVSKSWIGGTSGSWHIDSNWNPLGVPGPNDDVEIEALSNNATITISSDIQINSLAINSVAPYEVTFITDNTVTTTGSMTVTGMLRLGYSTGSAGDILDVNGALTLTNGIIARYSLWTTTDVRIKLDGTISMNDIRVSYIGSDVYTNVATKTALASHVRFEGDVNLPKGLTLGNYDLYLGVNADALTPNAVPGSSGNCIETDGDNTTVLGTVRKQYTAAGQSFTFYVSPMDGNCSPLTLEIIAPTLPSTFGTYDPWPHVSVRVVLNQGGQKGHPQNQQKQKVWVHWPVRGYGINEPVLFAGEMTFHNHYRNGQADQLYSARYTPLYELVGTGGDWDLIGSQQVTITTGSLRSVPFNGFPGFGDFTVGQGIPGGGDPVPVELTSFSARSLDGEVRLQWQTATETNNFGFAIERSRDGAEWEEVGFVPGAGTTYSPKSYTYNDRLSDEHLRLPRLAYRLRQMDRDGTTEYSNIVFVNTGELPDNAELYAAYPNPFNPTTTISFAMKEAANVTLKVYNTFGQEVATLLANSAMDAGLHTVPFAGDALPSGVYMAVLDANGVQQYQKLVLNK
ncbi:MAG: T9SS type A sorting domain-containing protein [Bacteroidota bacterium]|jgi:hypothetical protein|nr:T9SS type A sorting domain-containing protein [Bacteroidota bacterium]